MHWPWENDIILINNLIIKNIHMKKIESFYAKERQPMPLLDIKINRLTIGSKILIEGGSFSITSKEKIGFIGRNGSGKSTIIRLVENFYNRIKPPEDIDFKGTITLSSMVKIAFLPQEVKFSFTGTVREYLDFCGGEFSQVFNRYNELRGKESLSEAENEEYQEILQKMTELNLWNYDYRRNKIIERLGLKIDLSRDIQTLSGGEATKVALAGVLLSDANLWVLDEPTNNLDLDSINLLLEEIQSFKDSVLIITHDRRILNSLWKIIEIDEETKRIRIWGGNYEFYKTKKEEEFEARLRKYEEQEKKRKQLEEELERLKQESLRFEKISKDAFRRARGARLARRAKVMEERIRRELQKLTEPKPPERPYFPIPDVEFQKRPLVNVSKLTYKIGDQVLFDNLNIYVEGGDRVLIKGPIGVGKTTLLRLIVGELKPTSGEIRLNTTKIGYLPQAFIIENTNQKVSEFLKEKYSLYDDEIKKILAKLKIPEVFNLPMKNLSFGEIRRIQIAAILSKNPEVLILDEPTNHLDVYTVEELVQALRQYKGTIIFVSHDVSFIEDISPNKEITLSS
jgi:ATPase subunit of ABC transporter with duplicated ATPase domains